MRSATSMTAFTGNNSLNVQGPSSNSFSPLQTQHIRQLNAHLANLQDVSRKYHHSLIIYKIRNREEISWMINCNSVVASFFIHRYVS